jgi:Clp amino terminal domain, pathogenicity island component
MFERYTESTRVIFFARYGVSQAGHMTIESEHLLLGLVHEDGNILSRFVRDATLADVRDEITSRMAIKEKYPPRSTYRFPMRAGAFSRMPRKKLRD